MKKATCKELKGACDAEIRGMTPEEMGENSKKHVMQMVQEGDEVHLDAMQDLSQLSQEELEEWFEEFKQNFDSLENV